MISWNGEERGRWVHISLRRCIGWKPELWTSPSCGWRFGYFGWLRFYADWSFRRFVREELAPLVRRRDGAD